MDEPTSLLCFNEKKIKRLTITKPLSQDEIKNSRIRIGIEMLRGYKPELHEFEIIRKDKN